MIQVGETMTGVRLDSTAGGFDLEAHRGQWVVLYFYPKDNTSACTLEARDFTAFKAEFEELNAHIVGISRDTVRTHQGFCSRQELTIELASDKEEVLCQRFDVIKEKTMYGKKCRGIVRTTILINPQGVVTKVWSPVKVPGHVEEVLQTLKSAG